MAKENTKKDRGRGQLHDTSKVSDSKESTSESAKKLTKGMEKSTVVWKQRTHVPRTFIQNGAAGSSSDLQY
jgi:hypothetical protein